MLGWCLAAAGLAAGCGDSPPPPRATYLAIWSDAVEEVIRERALRGGSEALAELGPADEPRLGEALREARARSGVDDAAWRRATVAHERDTRDEIHLRASDLVHGWSQVARTPIGTVGRVLGETTEQALAGGWAPPAELHTMAVNTSFRVFYLPEPEDPRPPGLRQLIASRLPLEDPAAVDAVAHDVAAFREVVNAFVDRLLTVLPPERLRRTLSDQRLTDGMWEHARSAWRDGPPEPTAAALGQSDAGYRLLTEVDDRVAEVEDLARLIDAWWAAGAADAAAAYVRTLREEVRSYLADRVEAVASGAEPLFGADPAFQAEVHKECRERLAAQARADVPLRMLLLRRSAEAAAEASSAVATQVAAAHAVAAIPGRAVLRELVAAVGRIGVPDVPPFVVRFEMQTLATNAARDALAAGARLGPGFEDYLDRRIDAERGAKEALAAAIDGALAGR